MKTLTLVIQEEKDGGKKIDVFGNVPILDAAQVLISYYQEVLKKSVLETSKKFKQETKIDDTK